MNLRIGRLWLPNSAQIDVWWKPGVILQSLRCQYSQAHKFLLLSSQLPPSYNMSRYNCERSKALFVYMIVMSHGR